MGDGRGPTVEPAFDEEPHQWGPDHALAGWVIEPKGVVVQFMKSVRGTLALAEWLVGPGFEWVARQFPPDQKLTAVLDLSLMNGRSAAGRALLLQQAGGIGQRFSRFFVVPPIEYPPMYLDAFQESIAVARSFGVNIEVATSARDVVRTHGLQPRDRALLKS